VPFALEEAFHDWDGRYSSALQILREVIWSPETFKVPSEGTEFMSRILGGFPHLISSILHVEKWAHGKLKGQPMRDFPTKLPPADFGAKNRESSDARKVQVFEIHAFLLYLAALELDFSEWEPKFELMPPSCFVPSFMKGDVAYPMKGFWTWLRTELNCSTWVELAEKLQTTEQSIKNAANTKSLADAHSWSEFWRMMNNAQEAIDRTSPFMVQTSLAYGLARIIQEHASRCLDVVLEDFCEADDIENFYLRACPRSGLFEKSAF